MANWRAIVSRVPRTPARLSRSISSHSPVAKRARRTSATSSTVIVPSKSLSTANGLSMEEALNHVHRLVQGPRVEVRRGIGAPGPVEEERSHPDGLRPRHIAGAGVPDEKGFRGFASRLREGRIEDLRVRLPDPDGLRGRHGVEEGA